MQRIAIVNYNMGNLRSVEQALRHVADAQTEIVITASPEAILQADRVVFPGQGAARDCMRELDNHGLSDVIKEAAQEKPFLGICMGMQVLLEYSHENEGVDCLGLYQGEVRYFGDAIEQNTPQHGTERLKIPQMGWNQIHQTCTHPLWAGIPSDARFYFVHSYYINPHDQSLISGETEYGMTYASAIAKDNMFAIQAHPEKSADDGLQLLANFTHWKV